MGRGGTGWDGMGPGLRVQSSNCKIVKLVVGLNLWCLRRGSYRLSRILEGQRCVTTILFAYLHHGKLTLLDCTGDRDKPKSRFRHRAYSITKIRREDT